MAEESSDPPESVNIDNIKSNDDRSDTMHIVQDMQCKNTTRKTEGDIAIMTKYFVSKNETRLLEDIPPEELDTLLAKYFLNAKKIKDGSEYEPDSLKSHQSSLHRYLKEKNYKYDILQDHKFQHSRDVLSAKRKHLKTQGKGNKPYKANKLTSEEIDMLYSSGCLGTGSPQSLVNTMWWNNTTHFGLRSRKEHFDMRWGDISLKRLTTGEGYLEYNERNTKTRTGESTDTRPFNPKMFAAEGNIRCPVAAYKEYARQRPYAWKDDPDSPFYIAVNPKFNTLKGDCSWFIKQCIGKNKLGNILKTMCHNAGVKGRKVNHSARKTTVTSLLHSNVAPNQIMQITGHKNIHSVNNYSSASIKQQMEMSNILSNVCCGDKKENIQNLNVNNTLSGSNTAITTIMWIYLIMITSTRIYLLHLKR